MKIEVKGHSGCQIDVVNEEGQIFVYKTTADPKYLKRLALQAKKQQAAAGIEYQHIRVPKIYELKETDETTIIKMQYVYSKNFIEFFEQAGFEQVDYLIGALKYFIENEIKQCKMEKVSANVFKDKFAEIKRKCSTNTLIGNDEVIMQILSNSERIFDTLEDMYIPVGLCHGDLTFSNILFNGNNYYLIDFLDSFIETPLQDIVKIRQDTSLRWSQLMYTKRYDSVRLHIVLDKIDTELDGYFGEKYQWYRDYYKIMQLMNVLRILPYAHESVVIDYLKQTLSNLLADLKCVNDEELSVPAVAEHKSNTCSLIIPVAADKEEYASGLPYVFSLDKNGIVLCIKSIMGLPLEKFDSIYFTILRKHDEKFFISELMNLQFRWLGLQKAKVVVLDEPTRDQAETIFQTITKEKIKGSIFIKDGDSFIKTKLSNDNAVAIFPIEELDVLEPKNKSYVAVDDMYYLTNIIEKTVVGHHISAGGYAIKDVSLFVDYYHRLRQYGHLYLSHIIYAMLLDKKTFRPMIVEEYSDWGKSSMI